MPRDKARGRVSLAGAGPGPADLLTVRAARIVGGAQALLYDALAQGAEAAGGCLPSLRATG